jgi:transcription elongation factor GreA
MADEEIVYLTAEGKEDLERELKTLVNDRRPQLALKLKEAVAMGDLKENADYHDTREQMSLLDGRVQYIESVLKNAQVIQKTDDNSVVSIGSTVTIREEGTKEDETYMIVGAAEANPREGKISQKSPIGEALLGRKKGDSVLVNTPNGKVSFKIRKIE